MDADKKQKIESFKNFVKKEKEKEPDRSAHFLWRDGDIVPLEKKEIQEKHDLGDNSFDNPKIVFTSRAKHDRHTDYERQLDPHLHKYAAINSTFNDDHRRMLSTYKIDSEPLNSRLRNKDRHENGQILVPYQSHLKDYADLDHATSNTIDHHFFAWRGLYPHVARQMETGKIWQDHGYTGLSLSRTTAGGFAGLHDNPKVREKVNNSPVIMARVHITPGTKGFYINHSKAYPLSHEKEFLLHRGTQFQVIGHSINHYPKTKSFLGHDIDYGQTQHIIHLRTVGHDPKPLALDPDFKDD